MHFSQRNDDSSSVKFTKIGSRELDTAEVAALDP
jgi:hypothetical protein